MITFSIIIPTYNEENDIGCTLDALVGLSYRDVEIIVVDDSTDRTPQIVSAYKNVKLILPEKREGRCGARNIGIMAATGDVVVILNADVLLAPDFLTKIARHYENGFDYVLVKSRVLNMESPLARYIEYSGIADNYVANLEKMEWTEGFSCRKDIAVRAGLFPVGYSVPICAGEDGFFGSRLREVGARKIVDLSIEVMHISPARLGEYWSIRKGRGSGSPQVRLFLERWTLRRIQFWEILRIFKTVSYIATIVPLLYCAWRVSRHSSRKYYDLLPFAWAWSVEQVAFHVGAWKSIRVLSKNEKYKSS